MTSSGRRRSNEEASESETEESQVRHGNKKNKKSGKKTSDKSQLVQPEVVAEAEPEVRDPEFIQIYGGSGRTYDARNLDPATTYMFR